MSKYFIPNDRDLGRFHHWREQAIAYCQIPDNDWECLAQAQHYGLATRLLDWTLNPLVAVYFACISQNNCDGALYCYIPELYVERETLPLDAQCNGIGFGFVSRGITSRILNQKGVFTVHSPPNQTMRIPDSENFFKFIIPQELKYDLVKNLDIYGINHVTLFPDLDGLSEKINLDTANMCK